MFYRLNLNPIVRPAFPTRWCVAKDVGSNASFTMDVGVVSVVYLIAKDRQGLQRGQKVYDRGSCELAKVDSEGFQGASSDVFRVHP